NTALTLAARKEKHYPRWGFYITRRKFYRIFLLPHFRFVTTNLLPETSDRSPPEPACRRKRRARSPCHPGAAVPAGAAPPDDCATAAGRSVPGPPPRRRTPRHAGARHALRRQPHPDPRGPDLPVQLRPDRPAAQPRGRRPPRHRPGGPRGLPGPP